VYNDESPYVGFSLSSSAWRGELKSREIRCDSPQTLAQKTTVIGSEPFVQVQPPYHEIKKRLFDTWVEYVTVPADPLPWASSEAAPESVYEGLSKDLVQLWREFSDEMNFAMSARGGDLTHWNPRHLQKGQVLEINRAFENARAAGHLLARHVTLFAPDYVPVRWKQFRAEMKKAEALGLPIPESTHGILASGNPLKLIASDFSAREILSRHAGMVPIYYHEGNPINEACAKARDHSGFFLDESEKRFQSYLSREANNQTPYALVDAMIGELFGVADLDLHCRLLRKQEEEFTKIVQEAMMKLQK
jgi:hypothetical protein